MTAARNRGPALRVAVVGYGIAGIAAAIGLRAGGHEVDHFEAHTRLIAAGGGLLLQPAAIAMLARLGLSSELARAGVHVRRVQAASATGRPLMDIAYERAGHATCAIGIERSALFSSLQRADAAVDEVRVGARMVHVNPEHGLLVDVEGRCLGPYDLIVGADGANSALRRTQAAWRSREYQYPSAAIVGIVEVDAAHTPSSLQQFFFATHHVSFWPVAAADAKGHARLSVAVNVPRACLERGDTHALWEAHIDAVPAAMRPWSAAQAASARVYAFSYRAVHLRSYAVGRMVLIGDAAHAASPQLGHGVTMALEDAACIAACMRGQSSESVRSALETYQRERAPRLRRYQRLSRLATPLFQSNSRALAWLRDHLVLPLTSLGPVQRNMVRMLHAG